MINGLDTNIIRHMISNQISLFVLIKNKSLSEEMRLTDKIKIYKEEEPIGGVLWYIEYPCYFNRYDTIRCAIAKRHVRVLFGVLVNTGNVTKPH